MLILQDIFDAISSFGFPLVIAVFAIIAVIYVYNDGKKERNERQKIMDQQNDHWLSLYERSIAETAQLHVELSKNREIMAELKMVISNLFSIGVDRIKGM